MEYKYKETDEWKKEGWKSLGGTGLAIASNLLSVTSMDLGPSFTAFIQVATIVLIVLGAGNAFHYFTRPEKNYVVVDEQALMIDKGPFRRRKEIPLERIHTLTEREEVLVVKEEGLENSLNFDQSSEKETLIEVDNLSKDDLQRLKGEMKERTFDRVTVQ